jgi:hypothetical protein
MSTIVQQLECVLVFEKKFHNAVLLEFEKPLDLWPAKRSRIELAVHIMDDGDRVLEHNGKSPQFKPRVINNIIKTINK